MHAEEIVKELENCISYKQEDSQIVIYNKCDKSLNIKAIEVEYFVYIARSGMESTERVELGHLRKRVTERITIDQVLAPKSSLSIYFGIIRNLEAVYAVVEIGGKEYRIEARKEESQ
jgi:hypothetical protein